MNKTIRIGTRSSTLALLQTNNVQKKLQNLGYKTQIIPIKSTGDLIQNKPLYQLGITGIFTKALDIAMLNGNIDIAIHSMKDVPTILPEGIIQTAVLKRGEVDDILVYKNDLSFLEKNATIAIGSLRRKAQWLHKYPNHTIKNLRGNVQTRLKKLEKNNFDAAIFAKAGLKRINSLPKNHIALNWMIPAPAQGALVITALKTDDFSVAATSKLNHKTAEICTHIERQFLQVLEGGCTAPIGALAQLKNDVITFKGELFSLNGSKKITVSASISTDKYASFGKTCATEILNKGGNELIKQLKTKK